MQTIVKPLAFSAAGKGFITPRVFGTFKNKTVELTSTIPALKYGYIAMLATSGNTDHATDITKFEAGFELSESMSTYPPEMVFSFHMPESIEVRDSGNMDADKWLKVVEVPAKVMQAACNALKECYEVMTPAIAHAKKTVESAGLKAIACTLPVYGESTGKGKRASSGKAIPTFNPDMFK